jgi:hypothetical protein
MESKEYRVNIARSRLEFIKGYTNCIRHFDVDSLQVLRNIVAKERLQELQELKNSCETSRVRSDREKLLMTYNTLKDEEDNFLFQEDKTLFKQLESELSTSKFLMLPMVESESQPLLEAKGKFSSKVHSDQSKHRVGTSVLAR